MDNARVFAFLYDRLNAGEAAVLVTITSVQGSSMREAGTHMGVAADGSFAGSLSGGCIENAVVAEALEAVNEGAPRIVRFGAGSPYIDIKLPCGGGLDIHFLPLMDADFITACQFAITERRPFAMLLPTQGGAKFLPDWHSTEILPDGNAVIGHWPAPRLIVLGHGASVPALARLALQMHLEVEVLSSDPAIVAELESDANARHLLSPADTEKLNSDPWSAIVFLFHDHDWEAALMARAMELPHFYLGAMGGRKAHAMRTQSLKKMGCGEEGIAKIRAPIGLFHSSRDPESLALSALGEVVESYHAANFSNG
ncbi:MAG: XdhC family protein [Erythrobacter sp.]